MKQIVTKCPECGEAKFTVDWSSRDLNTPVCLKERHVCDKCGKRIVQRWWCAGWSVNETGKVGQDYLEKCVECGCEDLAITTSERSPKGFSETYKCESCGVVHIQIWSPMGWAPMGDDWTSPEIKVIDHERVVVGKECENGTDKT